MFAPAVKVFCFPFQVFFSDAVTNLLVVDASLISSASNTTAPVLEFTEVTGTVIHPTVSSTYFFVEASILFTGVGTTGLEVNVFTHATVWSHVNFTTVLSSALFPNAVARLVLSVGCHAIWEKLTSGS